MRDLIQIPPMARTVMYYLLAVANAIVVAGFIPDTRWASLIVGLAGVFGFTLAASNVSRAEAGPFPELVADDDPEDAFNLEADQ